VALCLARHLGWNFLDSGALYRLVALSAINRRVGITEEETLGRLTRELDVVFVLDGDEPAFLLDGLNVTGELRTEKVSAFSSCVAALPMVRSELLERQRAFRRKPGLVADGRDMGTVVFPDAQLKIFLTASAQERAKRRYKQLKEKGESVNLSRLFQDIEKRDERDRTRAVSPLRPADGAYVIDSSAMGRAEVFQEILGLLPKNHIVNLDS
jgi:cytidylate kinase